MKRSLSSLAAGLVVLVLALAAPAQERPSLDHARQRWEQLSPERRSELVQRFERFRNMSPEERALVRQRFESLKSQGECARRSLPEHVRRDFERLDPERQRQVVLGVAAEQLGERGRALYEMMPAPWRERLERTPAEGRPELIAKLRDEMCRHVDERFASYGRELGVNADELARLKSLPPHEMKRELMELERRRIALDVQREGPPAYVSAEQWSQWQGLTTPDFFEQWNEARRRAWPASCQAGGRGRGEGRGRELEDEKLSKLRDATRVDPSWFVETGRMPRDDQRKVIAARIRARILERLESEPGLIEPQGLVELQGLEGRAFFEALQRALPEAEFLGRWPHRSWHGDGESWRDGEARRGEAERPRPPGSGGPGGNPARGRQQRP